MGWCSGTDIFDTVVKHVLTSQEMSELTKHSLIYDLVISLAEQDWDCEGESEFYRHPLVQQILEEVDVFYRERNRR